MYATLLQRIGPGLLLALVGLVALSTPVVAQMMCTTGPTFGLQATSGYVLTPDGNSVFMWGYAPDSGPFQMPGPVLCVNQGQTVTINLTNNLPEPVSIVFPGQTGVTATGGTAGLLTREAPASGGTVTYTFTASQPGTYLYESGTQPHKQVHMGLYGVLVVRPSMGANFAYNDASTQFSGEFLLVLHEIDPVLHQAVEQGQPFNQTLRHDRYWTINGRSMPDLLLDNGSGLLPDQPYGALVRTQANSTLPILVRYANAGTVNHPFHPHGNHLKAIAQDGQLLGAAAMETFTRTIAAGQTFDLLFKWINVENWRTCTTPPCFTGDPGNGNALLPVQIPGGLFPPPWGLQDLVFKDDVTFYSGDPHLGFQGELPPTVVSFNECGEFYFPWHSHALQTVQNFDEGFGGMNTLVRVDPPAPAVCPVP
ncbi:MAG TPA: multicopper oxidase domain-containing protein [Candidatus Tectomicrobia bacterium]|jgi:FtsP/CotA-like multicopper oxidase with cupredoxin domain